MLRGAVRCFSTTRQLRAPRMQVVQWAAFYEHRLQEGSKAVFHIEAFVARVMAVYKNWALAAFA